MPTVCEQKLIRSEHGQDTYQTTCHSSSHSPENAWKPQCNGLHFRQVCSVAGHNLFRSEGGHVELHACQISGHSLFHAFSLVYLETPILLYFYRQRPEVGPQVVEIKSVLKMVIIHMHFNFGQNVRLIIGYCPDVRCFIVARLSKSLATLTLGSSKINQHC